MFWVVLLVLVVLFAALETLPMIGSEEAPGPLSFAGCGLELGRGGFPRGSVGGWVGGWVVG